MGKLNNWLATSGFFVMLFFFSCNLYLSIICDDIVQQTELENHTSNVTRFVTLEKSNNTCSEVQNFVFIKCMKCATETMASITRRFGYTRDLNFVLPNKHDTYLGWPYVMEQRDWRSSRRPYNILMEHAIFNKPIMQKIMPSNTVYITMIREPWDHFLSSFHYFALPHIVEIPGSDPVTEYFQHIYKYEERYTSSEIAAVRPCIPNGFSVTRNIQSHCLGMPLGFPKQSPNITSNATAVDAYIIYLDRHFDLVLIMEYFYESLVLLKRRMCWSLKDILQHRTNAGFYKHGQTYKKTNMEVHRHWSNTDYRLYHYFNRTLWRKIENEGSNFFREVEHTKFVQSVVNDFCFTKNNWNTSGMHMKVEQSEFNPQFIVTSDDCRLMKIYLLPTLKRNFDEREFVKKKKVTKFSFQWPPTRGCSIPGMDTLVEKLSLKEAKIEKMFPNITFMF